MDSVTLETVAQLEARVLNRLSGQVHSVRLAVKDDGLVLQGRARTYYAKQLALKAVAEATVLPVLANEIEVY